MSHREALSKKRIVQGMDRRDFSFGDTLFGDRSSWHRTYVPTLSPCVLTNLEGQVDNPEVGEEEGPLLDVELHLQL